MQKELICIGCPLGCNLVAEVSGREVISVTGNTCKRGEEYARTELTDPKRIVTTTLPVENRPGVVVSCKTAAPVPKDKITECLRILRGVKVQAPVEIGDVLAPDIAGTGVSVVGTKQID